MNKTKKEILTRDNIKKDLILAEEERILNLSEEHLMPLLPSILISALVGFITKSFILSGLILLIPVYHIIRLVYKLRLSIARKRMIKNGEFSIFTEKLSHFGEELIEEPHLVGNGYHRFKSVEYFYFSHGQWRVPYTDMHYKWSDLYYMSKTGLYNTSTVGTDFYIAILNGDEDIGYIYNTKLFELKEI